MNIDSIHNNLEQMKEIVREMYIFTNQLNQIKHVEQNSEILVNNEEKKLLKDAIFSLGNQLKILNNSIPHLTDNIGFYKKLDGTSSIPILNNKKLVQVSYNTEQRDRRISLIISDQDKKDFLDNISQSNLSINQLKKKYSVEKPMTQFGKPNAYAKISNFFFREFSNRLVSNGYFDNLNATLRKMNSPFVVNTYVSMIIFTFFWMFIISIFIFLILLFFNLSILYPFISPLPNDVNLLSRALSFFWIIFALPIVISAIMYFSPSGEARSLGAKIDQELPFVTIHMSAIANSGVEPLIIFKIILKSEEYKNTNLEFTKLINLINFHGKDIVSALKTVARSSPSQKLKELLDGFATALTSGGNLNEFLTKHSETLLFDYKLEREKYTKTSETFMDIYISIVIAAPMIFLMLFVIMGSTGILSGFLGLGVNELNLLIIFGIILINIGFLFFLRMKQPVI
ncbi:type II secretion system F family protein [Candidatus Pacearchaeota archaeon]|nr:type II secretion system F family protein [Candidatus Pacearchaeota archaeon]